MPGINVHVYVLSAALPAGALVVQALADDCG